jgi:hypothetical protein
MKLEFCRQILEKCLNNKFELTKFWLAFSNFVKEPKNPAFCPNTDLRTSHGLQNKVILFLYSELND